MRISAFAARCVSNLAFKKAIHVVLIVFMCLVASPVFAQDSDMGARLDLARQMHEFRPSKTQIDDAIAQVSAMVPEQEREAFKIAMGQVLNYKAIEELSVEAMAETYTEAELKAMVEYYAKPEAQSASDKAGAYAAKVQPEIVKMIDKAMMRMRTGGN